VITTSQNIGSGIAAALGHTVSNGAAFSFKKYSNIRKQQSTGHKEATINWRGEQRETASHGITNGAA